MKNKAYAEKFNPFIFKNKQAQHINCNSNFGMKGMKSNATPTGVKNGHSP